MRKIILLALVVVLFGGCSLFDVKVKPGYCVEVSFQHDEGEVKSLVCGGQTIKAIGEKIEEETGLDFWATMVGISCEEGKCELPGEKVIDDDTKKLLTD